MISYSKYKLLKEADAVAPPATGGAAPVSAAPTGDLGSTPDLGGGGPPPGFSGGPPMGGIGGGPPGPSMDLGGGLGSPGATGAAGMKPQGLKSNNVWDVLERILGGSKEEDKKDQKQKEEEG